MAKTYFMLAFLLCVHFHCRSQYRPNTNEGDDPYDTKTCGMFGINYLSDNVYLGRKDTITIPYYSPYAEFHHASGLYAKAMVSYTTAASANKIDLSTLEAGFSHTYNKDFDLGFNAEKYFYNKNSVSVRANMKGSVSCDAQYSNHWIEPSLQADLNFNKATTDLALGAALDHEIEMDHGLISLFPAVAAFAGTRNYYDEYLVNRLNKKDKANKQKHLIANAARFNLLSYELSCKATLRANHWLFLLKPTYSIPLNAATITLPKQTIREQLSNTFILELDICYRG